MRHQKHHLRLVLVALLVEGARDRRVAASRNFASVLAHLREPIHLQRALATIMPIEKRDGRNTKRIPIKHDFFNDSYYFGIISYQF